MNSRLRKGLRWFMTTMLFVVWVPVFKALYAFAYPDPGGKLAEALMILVGYIVLFGVPAFLLGLATWRRPPVEAQSEAATDSRYGSGGKILLAEENAIYSAISDELESGAIDKALWTRLFAEYGGDENKTKAAYIRRRAEILAAAKLQKNSTEKAAQISNQPTRRWPWAAGSIALLLVVTFHLTYILRTELAVVAPEIRPALVAGCELVGCTVPRPVKPELVGIETSDLAPEGDGLLLTAKLKNRAPFEQDFPNLELTLTDTQDEALVRKVLIPADYLPAEQSAEQGFAARGEVAIRLNLMTDDVPAVGYRLYLFFPSSEPERLSRQINPDVLRLMAMQASNVYEQFVTRPAADDEKNVFDQFDAPTREPSKKNAFGWRMPSQEELTPIADVNDVHGPVAERGMDTTQPGQPGP
ncbi:MAG: DUF3426 domain-containing protein [Pseudomonadota bacterium]